MRAPNAREAMEASRGLLEGGLRGVGRVRDGILRAEGRRQADRDAKIAKLSSERSAYIVSAGLVDGVRAAYKGSVRRAPQSGASE